MFAVIGSNNLLFSLEMPSIDPSAADKMYQYQFMLYSSLDALDFSDPTAFHECIDTVDSNNISAYVTAGKTVFLLVHPRKKSDSIKKFFKHVHKAYTELLMNPFYQVGSIIENEKFKNTVLECSNLITG
ncbi:hypothetical protein TVAG_308100 [Trichomonas vaginalis G3]|uniref:Trafficking protein particle complex subunit 2-like protein n=1 Tax=Trichomonas vaginalis (strain ATCC PRA-98 / G3) TaxID=412133 RepID=A2EGK9_TRIV3|nr:ER to Golgi vesicle-mediated transport [Trichomonas vaginalis G3]EAY08204.1 hypothetical protein TVAG_308100 [Trichomonas vaginalis G3]KAI5519754.1 ER to Golgi vesicle-mediated transport [Trichomonas vaginalis G3]|eukprot:XP_001320427.1 hypothetical protein [Trichomonas vaginalis G3]